MRFLLKVSMPNEAANELARKGQLGQRIAEITDDIKPEAAYFVEESGLRTGFLIVQVPEASDIPRIAEPLFLGLNATVEFHPTMLPEDLEKAIPHIEAAAKKYG